MKKAPPQLSLPEKANRILNGILVVLILIAVRIWHLAVIQHDEKVEEAWKPQRRTVVEQAERATICDRFNIPLAVNKVQYNVAITYASIRQLPRSIWRKNEEGKREKYFYRKEYISELAHLLEEELHLDANRVEDLIHSKAAILGSVPCIVKENITEKQYFRLRMLEKDWPGLQPEIAAKRYYPLGSVGAEVVGYIGAISRREYDSITQELQSLRTCLAQLEMGEEPLFPDAYPTVEEVKSRLEELEKKAYTINDHVGKVGVEAAFDESLRGLRGKHIYLCDRRGNFLKELPGSEDPVAGFRLVLSLSSELQAYAEQLLREYEKEPYLSKYQEQTPSKQPWIKGGAIVAMHPTNGEIYALASYPIFDPNDFIRVDDPEEKNLRIEQWLETERHLANLWNFKTLLSREQESIEINWDNYLDLILPEASRVRQVIEKKNTLQDAIWLQRKVDQLLSLFKTDAFDFTAPKVFDFLFHEGAMGVTLSLQEREFLEERLKSVQPQVDQIQEELFPFFKSLQNNYDKLMLTDLYRIVVDGRRFSPFMAHLVGGVSLNEYREMSGTMVSVDHALRKIVKELFRDYHFAKWREEEFKPFLAEKRLEEKKGGQKYAKPYIEYLDQAEKELFKAFWESHRWDLLALFLTGESEMREEPYFETLKNWASELKAGAYPALAWTDHYHRLAQGIDQLDPTLRVSYLKTLRSFDELDRPLLGRYAGLRGRLEKHLAAAFYPTYGFGYSRSHAFRQATTIGSIFKLVPAYEGLRQAYLKKGVDRGSLNPLVIIDDKHRVWGKDQTWNVGYTLDGRPIPMYYRGGRLPRTEHSGVGRVDLVKALEASSNPYFSMLAGDFFEDPDDLVRAANLFGYGEKTGINLPGEYSGSLPKDVTYNRTGLYAMAIGQHSLVGTPLQSAVMLAAIANGGNVLKPKIVKNEEEAEVRWRVFMPPQIQNLLLAGLQRVIMGEKGTARFIRGQFSSDIINQIVGKTSTAEVVERMSLEGGLKLKHIGFGSIVYETTHHSKPELIIVIYLRHGQWGRLAAPFAVKMAKKWREIQSKYN